MNLLTVFKRLFGRPIDEGKSEPWATKKYLADRGFKPGPGTKAHHARRDLRKSKRRMRKASRRANRK